MRTEVETRGLAGGQCLLVAFGQKKMFKRITPALLHFVVYSGFLIINIEGIEFFLDGLTGGHRVIAQWLARIGHLPVLHHYPEYI